MNRDFQLLELMMLLSFLLVTSTSWVGVAAAIETKSNSNDDGGGYVSFAEYTTSDCSGKPVMHEARLLGCHQQGDHGSLDISCENGNGDALMQVFKSSTTCGVGAEKDVLSAKKGSCIPHPISSAKRYIKIKNCVKSGALPAVATSPKEGGFCSDTYTKGNCKGTRRVTRCEMQTKQCVGASKSGGVKVDCPKKELLMYSSETCNGKSEKREENLLAAVPFQIGKCLGVEDDDDDEDEAILSNAVGDGDGSDSGSSKVMIIGCDEVRVSPLLGSSPRGGKNAKQQSAGVSSKPDGEEVSAASGANGVMAGGGVLFVVVLVLLLL